MASYCWECVAVKHKTQAFLWMKYEVDMAGSHSILYVIFRAICFLQRGISMRTLSKVCISIWVSAPNAFYAPYPATQPSIHCINTMIVEDSSHYSQSSSAHLSSNNVPLTFWSDSFLISFTKQHNNSVWLTSQGNNPRQSRSGHDGSYQANG